MTNYGTDIKKAKNNHAETQLSAPLLITCLVEEGAITVASAETGQYRSRMNSEKIYTFARPVAIGDKVQLTAADNAYTLAACKGMPVVQKYVSTNTTPIIGEVVGYPMPLLAKPTNDAAADTIAERVTGSGGNPFMRTVLVKVLAMGYEAVSVHGACLVGEYVKWDNSEQQYASVTTNATHAICCHYTAGDTDCGILIMGPIEVQA